MWPIVLTVAGFFAIAVWLTVFTKRSSSSSSSRRAKTTKFRAKSSQRTVIDPRIISYPMPAVTVAGVVSPFNAFIQIITVPTNSPQSFTAPSGANFLSVYVNGGGGGGGNSPGVGGGTGGAGAAIATVFNHPITPGTVYTAFIDGSTGLTNPAAGGTSGANATLTVGTGGTIMNIVTTGGQGGNFVGTAVQGGNVVASVDGTILPTQTGGIGSGQNGTVYTATNIRIESGGGADFGSGANATPFVGGNDPDQGGGGGASGFANGGDGGATPGSNGSPGTGLGAGGGGGDQGVSVGGTGVSPRFVSFFQQPQFNHNVI